MFPVKAEVSMWSLNFICILSEAFCKTRTEILKSWIDSKPESFHLLQCLECSRVHVQFLFFMIFQTPELKRFIIVKTKFAVLDWFEQRNSTSYVVLQHEWVMSSPN